MIAVMVRNGVCLVMKGDDPRNHTNEHEKSISEDSCYFVDRS
jgi:hypothetical protein